MKSNISFIQENTKTGLRIPLTALKISGIAEQPLEYRTLSGAVVAFKSRMTAMELITAANELYLCASTMLAELMENIGPCDGCTDNCEYEDENLGHVLVPEYLREQAGIPADAKVVALPDQDTGTVTIMQADYRYDLQDVPSLLLEMFMNAGVCLESLEMHLMDEDIVYGGE
ncbi:MAG: hypothetical protein IJV64_01545 [Oscillospiraceae bacterium]|nr:hypothetical protein [Oscillospiraceae bacterium]